MQSQSGATALLMASERGHTAVVLDLCKSGADPNHFNAGKRATALIQASRYGYEETVATLLESGADVSQKLHDGRTALYLAAQGGYDESWLT